MSNINEGYVVAGSGIKFCLTPAKFWCGIDGPYADEKIKRRSSVNNYVAAPVMHGSDGNLYVSIGRTCYLIPVEERIHIQGDPTINLSAMTGEQQVAYIKYINYLNDAEWIEDYAKRTRQTPLEAAREVWNYRKGLNHGHDAYNGIICGYDVVKGVKLETPAEPFVIRF